MAGTIPISMTQQFDVLGKPLAGGQLYIIQVGTVSTPQDAFQDTGLVVKQPYPMTLDAAGRVPQFFLADGSVKIRLQDKNGVVQLASDSVLVIGPSAGGGGGGAAPVEASAVFQTGDMKARYAFGVHPGAVQGWVRANGLTIGSATSGASMPEGARLECQALFLHLYAADSTLVVSSGGRTGNALNDWNANKNIATPDFRGHALGGLDGMGNSLAGRLTAAYAGLGVGGFNPDVLGAVAGLENVTMASANIYQHSHANTVGETAHQHKAVDPAIADPGVLALAFSGGVGFAGGALASTNLRTTNTGLASAGVTISNANFGSLTPTPMRTIGPRKLVTFYIKL